MHTTKEASIEVRRKGKYLPWQFVPVMLCFLITPIQASAASLSQKFLDDPLGFYRDNFRELAANKDVAGGFWDIDTCMWSNGISAPYIERLASIAIYDKGVRNQLRKRGFPDEVWFATYDKIIVTQVKLVRQYLKKGRDIEGAGRLDGIYELELKMYKALVKYNKKQGNRLNLPDKPSEFCGGDFIGLVSVASSPPGASISLISDFSFKLCRAANIDPYSRDCDEWAEIGGDSLPAGMYRYRATWNDGNTTCDRVDLNPPGGWLEGPDEIVPMTIKKGGRPCS